jgi:DNA-binding LytR/AlgR family response regulator
MILDWLLRPYPFVTETSVKWALSMMIGLICFLFLAAFRPFGLHEVENVTYIAGFGLTAFLSLFIHYFILPRIFPVYFDENSWNIWKQLVFFASIVLIISVLNYAYNSTVGVDISPQYNLPYFIVMTTLTGILPIVTMTYVIERIENNRNREVAETVKFSSLTSLQSELVTIKSENQSERDLQIPIESFLYASASSNYLDLFYLENDQVKTAIIRLSLKALLNQLQDYPQIRRVHKSFVINVNNIVSVEGNARSLNVQLKQSDTEIPVSRSIARETLL